MFIVQRKMGVDELNENSGVDHSIDNAWEDTVWAENYDLYYVHKMSEFEKALAALAEARKLYPKYEFRLIQKF